MLSNSRPKFQRAHLEFSAGGIVFRKGARAVELAFLLDPFRKWTFAKGHLEPGETATEAALRETKEEMGIVRLKIVAPLGRMDWYFREQRKNAALPQGALIHKFVDYFLMQAPPHTQLKAQSAELIRAVRWVPVSQALRQCSYKNVQPILRRALQYLYAVAR